jgi:RNA polymerase sigma-32 factor
MAAKKATGKSAAKTRSPRKSARSKRSMTDAAERETKAVLAEPEESEPDEAETEPDDIEGEDLEPDDIEPSNDEDDEAEIAAAPRPKTKPAVTRNISPRGLPSVSAHGGLTRYLEEIRQFPMLEPQQEYMLAKRWQEHGDRDAAHQLVTSHLRLVARIAMGYRGYGLPTGEVISEGNVGLMQAVKRFDPDRGFRLATYAMWWIRAAIQEYILRSWSLVKMGTTAAQKKLFFNLRKMKGQLKALDEGDLHPDQVKKIATSLGVSEDDVVSMNRRLGGDSSLNAPIRNDSESGEWMDWLVDDKMDQETALAESEEHDQRHALLLNALDGLNERERRVFEARRLSEDPLTLEELSGEFGVSRERIRQIEVRAFEKVQKAVQKAAAAQREPASVD